MLENYLETILNGPEEHAQGQRGHRARHHLSEFEYSSRNIHTPSDTRTGSTFFSKINYIEDHRNLTPNPLSCPCYVL